MVGKYVSRSPVSVPYYQRDFKKLLKSECFKWISSLDSGLQPMNNTKMYFELSCRLLDTVKNVRNECHHFSIHLRKSRIQFACTMHKLIRGKKCGNTPVTAVCFFFEKIASSPDERMRYTGDRGHRNFHLPCLKRRHKIDINDMQNGKRRRRKKRTPRIRINAISSKSAICRRIVQSVCKAEHEAINHFIIAFHSINGIRNWTLLQSHKIFN